MKIMTLASRNVLRNWHRTMITTLAMAFACCIMIIFSTLMEGMVLGSERQAVILNQGDIQIHAVGYHDDPDIYKTIKNQRILLIKLSQKDILRHHVDMASDWLRAMKILLEYNSME